MYTSGYILRTSTDFDNAVFFKKVVTVWQNGTLLNYGEKIQALTDLSVTMEDGRYLKAPCVFKVR